MQLAGGVRPAQIGAARACISARPEARFWVEDPAAVYAPLGCFDLGAGMADYALTIDPRALPASATGTMLLRIESDAWTPSKIDGSEYDTRALGVQFGGLALGPAAAP